MNGTATFGDEYGPESVIYCGAQIVRLLAIVRPPAKAPPMPRVTAGPWPAGSAAVIPARMALAIRWMVWAIRSTSAAEAISAEAMGEAEAVATAEAINACQPWNKPDRILI